MLIGRLDLLQKLEAVSAGLAPRENVEQSSCFVFRAGEVMTYNTEVACRMTCPLDIEGAIPAAPLITLLQKMAEEDIDITVGEGCILVKGRGKRAQIRMQAEVLLPIDAVEVPEAFSPLHEHFCEAVAMAVQVCGSDDAQGFYITCVHIHPEFVEACDNWQLTRFPLATGVERPILVKREAIKHIHDLEVMEVAETKSWIHFRNTIGLTYSLRRYVETFPNLDAMVDFTGEPVTLPGGLADAVDKAQIFSDTNAENKTVKVELRQDKMRLTGAGTVGVYEEQKNTKYGGPPISFLVSPKLLIELTKRHNECEIIPGRLKINGGRWVYVTCLGIEGDKDFEPQEEAPSEE